jgi:hypothetical protein
VRQGLHAGLCLDAARASCTGLARSTGSSLRPARAWDR